MSPSLPNPFAAELLHRSWLSEKTFEVELRRPSALHFQPGQRIRFVRGTMERDYTPISAPGSPRLALCVRLVAAGRFSPVLAAADIGTLFSFTGPHGYFIFQPSPRPPIFVATGTGVAPFVSMTRAGLTGFTILHGVRRADELYYQVEIRVAAGLYVPCLSHAPLESALPPYGYRGLVTKYLRDHLAPGTYDFYLCGRREMVRDVTLLVDERFPGSRIYTEIFY